MNISYFQSESVSFIQAIWTILDTNLVSSFLGSILFATVAGLILNALIGRRERQSLRQQVDLILTKAIKNNLEAYDALLEHFNKNNMPMAPNPFNVSPLQIILQGQFVEVMSPELVSEVTTAYRYCIMINSHQARYAELAIGVASALQESPKIREVLIQECLQQMPGLKASHIRTRKLLKAAKA